MASIGDEQEIIEVVPAETPAMPVVTPVEVPVPEKEPVGV